MSTFRKVRRYLKRNWRFYGRPNEKTMLRSLFARAIDWYGDVSYSDTNGFWLSLIVPLESGDQPFLEQLLKSIRDQHIDGVEVIFHQIGTIQPDLNHRLLNSDLVPITSDEHVFSYFGASFTLSDILTQCRGKWVAFLGPNDLLAPFALKAICEVIQANAELKFIYTDNLIIDCNSDFVSTDLKPAFDPILLSETNYVHQLSVFRKDHLFCLAVQERVETLQNFHELIIKYAQNLPDKEIRHLPYPAYWSRETNARSTNSALFLGQESSSTSKIPPSL